MHKKTFVSEDFRIRFTTDSRNILSLVNNFLDFNGKGSPDAAITLDIRIRKKCVSKCPLVYPDFSTKHDKWTGSLAAFLPIAEVRIDYKKRRIESAIREDMDFVKEPALDFAFFQPLRMIMARNGLYCLHASAVQHGDTCILIPGTQNAGKSTIAFLFVKHGFKILCDDDCFFRSSNSRILLLPFPTKMGIRDGLLDNHPDLRKLLISDYRYGGKHRTSLRRFYGPKKLDYNNKVILFPRFSANKKLSIRSLPKDKALRLLMAQNTSPWMMKEGSERCSDIFFAFRSLVDSAECFEVVYSDKTADRIPGELQKKWDKNHYPTEQR